MNDTPTIPERLMRPDGATIQIPSGRLLHTNCGQCGLHLGNNVFSCDGFTDGYDQYACRCDCHEKGRA